jgi:uncharacterized protein (TIGR02246 family)
MLMRILAVIVVITAACADCAAQALARSDEAAIRKQLNDYADAREHGDAHAAAMHYTADADLRLADGTMLRGRDAIQHSMPSGPRSNATRRIALTIHTMRLIGEGIAVADGVAAPTGNYATYVMVKQNNVWWIAAARIALANVAK